jgi:hypothetical protein
MRAAPKSIVGLSLVRVVLQAQRAEDFQALRGLVDVSHLLLCEGGPKAEAVAEELGAQLHTLEDIEQRRRPWSNADMDALTVAFAAILRDEPDITVLPYAASVRLDQLGDLVSRTFRVASPSARLKLQFDDKIRTREAFRSLDLPVIDSERIDQHTTFDRLAHKLGVPFILQQAVSSGGTGTYLVSSADQLIPHLTRNDAGGLIASRRVGRETVNVHGFILEDRVHVSPMSIQLDGIESLTDQPFVYCGNDFSAVRFLDEQIRATVAAMTTTVGEWMRRMGWWGVFGMDYRVDGDRAWPIEVNPRFQGSTWVLADAELAAGITPLAGRQLGIGRQADWLDWHEVIERSQVIEHQLRGQPSDRSADGLMLEVGAVKRRHLLTGGAATLLRNLSDSDERRSVRCPRE